MLDLGNSNIFLLLSVPIIGILIVKYFILSRKKPSNFFLILCTLCVLFTLSTYINSADILRCIKIDFTIISAAIWAEIFLNQNFTHTIKCVAHWAWFLLFLNFLIDLLIPAGVYADEWGNEYTFLSLANSMEIYWIPFFAFCMYQSYNYSKIFLPKIAVFLVFVFIPSYNHTCDTGILLVVFMCLVSLGIVYIKSNKKLLLPIWPVIYGIGIVLVIIIVGSTKIFPFLSNYNTLMIRIGLWKNAIKQLEMSPIIGFGVGSTDEILFYNQWRNYSPHNMYIMILLWGGVLALICFIWALIYATKGKKINDKAYAFFIISFISYLIYLLMEVNVNMTMFIILLFAIYIYPNRYRDISE